MKYLLSTGQSTNLIEYYIIDLFNLYLKIYPNDIPGAPNIGFNFIFTDVKKSDIISEIRSRVDSLISKIGEKFTSTNLSIKLISLDLIDETKVKLKVRVNQIESNEITVNIGSES